LIASSNREAEQLETLREYNKAKQAEKDAEKEARVQEVLQHIMNVDTGNIKSYTLKEINAQLGLETNLNVVGQKKKAPEKPKKELTDEEKKEKQREYHRKRYAALKAKKNQ
jgi:hypothetical protein